MMNFRGYILFLCCVFVATFLSSCRIQFSFHGASIPDNVKTVKVDYITNTAAMVAPTLSPTLTDELISMIQRQTRLQFVNDTPDVLFEGEVIDYRTEPIAVSGTSEYAEMNRLTIAVRMNFTNRLDPKLSYKDKTFVAYGDYPSSQMLSSAESSLIPEITKKIVEDIFNAAFSQW